MLVNMLIFKQAFAAIYPLIVSLAFGVIADVSHILPFAETTGLQKISVLLLPGNHI
jgi:hypothetical protein